MKRWLSWLVGTGGLLLSVVLACPEPSEPLDAPPSPILLGSAAGVEAAHEAAANAIHNNFLPSLVASLPALRRAYEEAALVEQMSAAVEVAEAAAVPAPRNAPRDTDLPVVTVLRLLRVYRGAPPRGTAWTGLTPPRFWVNTATGPQGFATASAAIYQGLRAHPRAFLDAILPLYGV